MRTAVLVAAVAIGWGGAVAVATAGFGPGHLRPSLAALALCLVPAVGALRAVELAAGHPAAVPVFFLGSGVRMGVAVVGLAVLADRAAGFGGRERLTGWVVVMYLLTLAVETALAAHAVRPAPRPVGPR